MVAVSLVVVVGGRVVVVVMSRSMERVRGERVTLECLRGKVTTGYIFYTSGEGVTMVVVVVGPPAAAAAAAVVAMVMSRSGEWEGEGKRHRGSV